MVEQKIRKDVYIYNEATGFVITSGNRNFRSDSNFDSSEPTWEASINDGSFLPIQLVQDDSLVLRVLVNDDLNEQEQAEWIDRFEWKLAIPDGKLVIAAGIEFMWGEEMDGEFVQTLEVEPGTYKVELFTLLPGVNGGNCLGLEDEEHAAYFKKTRPGEPMPEWMYDWLDLEEEGNEDEEDDEYFVDDEDDLVHDPSKKPPSYIDFILRLSPLTEQPQRPKLDEGWIDVVQNPRKPEKCPVGILAPWVAGIHDQPIYVRTELHYHAKVWEAVQDHEPQAVKGGPATIAIEDLALPYWVAWLCSQGTFVSLKLDLKGSDVVFDWPGLEEDVLVTNEDGSFTIDLDGMNAKWAQPPRLARLGQLLSGLPDGAILEMATSQEQDEDDDEDGLVGLHRYRGEVRASKWHIEAAYPAVSKETLEDALEIARQVDRREAIRFNSEEELNRVVATFQKHDFLLRENPPVRQGLTLKSEKEPLYTALIGSWLLRERHPDAWPYEELDDELESWDAMMSMIEQKLAAPTTGEVLLSGATGTFSVANMLDMQSVVDQEVYDLDENMMKLGFAHLGDLVSSKFSDIVLRAYAHAQEPVYGVMIRSTIGGAATDFYSVLEDGWSLTSSTISGHRDAPQSKAYKQSARDIEGAWGMHQKKLSALEGKHGKPVQIERTLVGFAGALDEFLQRTT